MAEAVVPDPDPPEEPAAELEEVPMEEFMAADSFQEAEVPLSGGDEV